MKTSRSVRCFSRGCSAGVHIAQHFEHTRTLECIIMSSSSTVTFICEQLVKDLKNQIIFPSESGWELQAMCQRRDYGCRLVFQLFNMQGKNMKSQMILRVEDISELGQVHEFLNGCRNYFTRHAIIVTNSISTKLEHSTDTLCAEDEPDTINDDLENSQLVN